MDILRIQTDDLGVVLDSFRVPTEFGQAVGSVIEGLEVG
jgi:hypothetical protein